MEWIANYLSSVVVMATPLLLTAGGSVFSERSGILNIGYEGLMLIGAFFGVTVSWVTGNALVGALGAMLSGMLLNLLFALFALKSRANQVVIGLAINTLASGLTITLNRLIFGVSTSVPDIAVFESVAIPLLSEIPVIGPALFNQPLLVYIAFLLIPVYQFVLKRTNIGLKVRSVGENPYACDTLGIKVNKVRLLSIMYSGLMAGLGGAFLSMGQLSFFVEGMVSGRGFMALAAVVFGNYSPKGILGAALLFGAADAIQYRLQATSTDIPYQIWIILPYLITIIALCCYRRKSNCPAYYAKPFLKK